MASYDEFGTDNPDNPDNSSNTERREIDYKIVAEIAYDAGLAVQKHIGDVIYNETFFGLMFQLTNFIVDYVYTSTGQIVQPQQVSAVLQQILRTMYEMQAFDKIQMLVREKYETERAVDRLLESVNLPPRRHDDDM